MEWQPIETASKSRTEDLLLWFPWTGHGDGCVMIGVWGYPPDESSVIGPCWVDPGDFDVLGEPSHWMPLPAAPK